jgi:hypothetical protein
MCDHCDQIDEKLQRYRFMARWLGDPTVLEGLAFLTAKYEAKRRTLHPDETVTQANLST